MIVSIYVLIFILLAIYLFVLLKYIRCWNSTPDFSLSELKNKTFISVIVPFFNERENIRDLVGSILQQTLDKELWEVVFIDDHSGDNTSQIIHELCRDKINYRLEDNIGSGKKQALITGLQASKGKLLITTDADCMMHENQLRTILSFYEKHHPDMIIMPVKMAGNDSFLQYFQSVDFLALQLVGAGSALAGNPILCNGANLAFGRQAIKDIDLKKRYASGEDMFMLEWMKHKNRDIKYLRSKDVIVRTNVPGSLKQFLLQRTRWISKAGGYRDRSIVWSSLLFFGVNLGQLVLFVSGLVDIVFLPFWVILFILKTATDHYLLYSGSAFFEINISLGRSVLMQFIYPFYILTVSFAGLIWPVKWKTEKYF